MNKKALKKEAEKYLKQKLEERKDKFVFELPEVYIKDVNEAYLASAEPREKQIQIDAEQIRALQKQNGELTDKVRKLEQQIEKMKRCSICKYSSNLGYCKIRCNGGECNKMDKWEIKEE